MITVYIISNTKMMTILSKLLREIRNKQHSFASLHEAYGWKGEGNLHG